MLGDFLRNALGKNIYGAYLEGAVPAAIKAKTAFAFPGECVHRRHLQRLARRKRTADVVIVTAPLVE